MLWLAAAVLQTMAPPAVSSNPPSSADDVVVVATRKRCAIAVANQILSSSEFKRRSADWARGTPVRVVVPAGSNQRCLTKIMFRLAERGVTRALFVDR